MLPLTTWRPWPPAVRVAVLLSVALAVAACGDGNGIDPQDADPGTLRVVTTVSPITSLVENVGGTRIRLQGIVPEGVNSHTFEPAPSVAQVMSEADLIVLNGLFLEEPSLEMAEANRKPGAVILALADRAITRDEWVFDFSFPESGRASQPAPVDQPGAGNQVRRADPGRADDPGRRQRGLLQRELREAEGAARRSRPEDLGGRGHHPA